MEDAKTATLTLKVASTAAQKALQDFIRTTEGVTVAANRTAGSLGILSKHLVGIVAAYASVRTVRDWTRAAMEQEKVETALAAALARTGDATVETIGNLKTYAGELQRLTVYGDEQILTEMTYAKNLGVTSDALDEVAHASIGLAELLSIDLHTATQLVARATQGHTGEQREADGR